MKDGGSNHFWSQALELLGLGLGIIVIIVLVSMMISCAPKCKPRTWKCKQNTVYTCSPDGWRPVLNCGRVKGGWKCTETPEKATCKPGGM